MKFILSIMFDIKFHSIYSGMKRSPLMIRHIIKLLFGIEIEVKIDILSAKDVNKREIRDILLDFEKIDPDIIEVDRDFILFIIKGQEIVKAGRIYFELFRNKVKNLDFYDACRKVRGFNPQKLLKSSIRSYDDFSLLLKYYPELLTYHSSITKERHNIFKKKLETLVLNYEFLVKKSYGSIRTYTTVYTILTRSKQIEARKNILRKLRGEILYNTLNAFILEVPEIAEHIFEICNLEEIIENVPCFYIAFDNVVKMALADEKYLVFVEQMLLKYPIRVNVEKTNCLQQKYPEFAHKIQTLFL